MEQFKDKLELPNINADGVEETDDSSKDAIENPFDPTKIDIIPKQLSIDILLKRIKNNRINLKTEFQREADLWKAKAQSRLIESLLVRIPLPAFYFDGSDDSNWLVVDGLQRLSALKNFVINKTLKLTELEYLKEYSDKNIGFDELPPYLQSRIEETQITAHIINPGTPTNVKYNIFKRINTGGLVLSAQEIRHALNQGIPADFVKELAELPEFVKATAGAVKPYRMENRDFITRFIGFYFDFMNYKPDLDTFLNEAMNKLKTISGLDRQKIKDDFIKSMNLAYQIFENDAFRKRYNKNDSRKPVNKAVFDTIAVNFSKLTEQEIQMLLNQKEIFKDKFIELMNDIEFNRAISSGTGDIWSVQTRFIKINKLIKSTIYAE